MRLHYLTRMDFTANRAHIYNTAKTCEAMQMTGKADVLWISTDASFKTGQDVDAFFKKHSVTTRFGVKSLNSFANAFGDSSFRLFNYLEVVLANLSLAAYVLRERKNIDAVYFREPLLLIPIWIARKVLRKPVFFENHAFLIKKSSQRLNEYLVRISSGVISISEALGRYYAPMNSNGIVSFCASAEPQRFAAITDDVSELRSKLGLPPEAVILGYTGNLYRSANNESYGIEDIVRALPFAPDIIFAGVGKKGNETEGLINYAKSLGVAERVLLLPWAVREKAYEYMKAFDILAVPAQAARLGSSPTKMFEYLAAGKPIVAADTEAISEVLHDGENALLVDYKKPEAWAEAFKKIISDSELKEQLVQNALDDSKKYTWPKRGEAIAAFITKTLHEKVSV